MLKKEIKLYDTLYWNTTGAYGSKISQGCEVIDIGKNYIWVLVFGNLLPEELSKEPLYKVTNRR